MPSRISLQSFHTLHQAENNIEIPSVSEHVSYLWALIPVDIIPFVSVTCQMPQFRKTYKYTVHIGCLWWTGFTYQLKMKKPRHSIGITGDNNCPLLYAYWVMRIEYHSGWSDTSMYYNYHCLIERKCLRAKLKQFSFIFEVKPFKQPASDLQLLLHVNSLV